MVPRPCRRDASLLFPLFPSPFQDVKEKNLPPFPPPPSRAVICGVRLPFGTRYSLRRLSAARVSLQACDVPVRSLSRILQSATRRAGSLQGTTALFDRTVRGILSLGGRPFVLPSHRGGFLLDGRFGFDSPLVITLSIFPGLGPLPPPPVFQTPIRAPWNSSRPPAKRQRHALPTIPLALVIGAICEPRVHPNTPISFPLRYVAWLRPSDPGGAATLE